jgi:hypothetical protein
VLSCPGPGTARDTSSPRANLWLGNALELHYTIQQYICTDYDYQGITPAPVDLALCPQLICWKSGQYSRVHNHASSHCWLTLLSGEVEEEAYEISPDGVASMRPGSPRPVMPGGWVGV